MMFFYRVCLFIPLKCSRVKQLTEEEGHKLSERSEFFASQIRPMKRGYEDLNCDRLRQLRKRGEPKAKFSNLEIIFCSFLQKIIS